MTLKKQPSIIDPNDVIAAEEFNALDQDAVRVIATWWAKWYMKTGHKRLGRMIVSTTKE